jgi:hypothetical protein
VKLMVAMLQAMGMLWSLGVFGAPLYVLGRPADLRMAQPNVPASRQGIFCPLLCKGRCSMHLFYFTGFLGVAMHAMRVG